MKKRKSAVEERFVDGEAVVDACLKNHKRSIKSRPGETKSFTIVLRDLHLCR